MKIIDYRVCWDRSCETLSDEVKLAIEQGWEPFGTIAMNSWEDGDDIRFRYIQGMVKREESK